MYKTRKDQLRITVIRLLLPIRANWL